MLRRLCFVFMLAVLFDAHAFAQTLNATLGGTVTDNSGSAVTKAEVILLEPKTGQTIRKANVTQTGNYEFNELEPGTYELRCSAPGFKVFVAQDVVLDSGQTRRLDAS